MEYIGNETNKINAMINEFGGTVDSDMLKDIIRCDEPRHNRLIELYEEYCGEVPILNRQSPNPLKIDSKLVNAFRTTIVDQVVGYLFGKPVDIHYDKSLYTEEQNILIDKTLDEFDTRNKIDILNSQTGTYMSACGEAARLCYIDKNGNERVMNIKPWESIFIYDQTFDELQYGIIYYDFFIQDNAGKMQKKIKVELYDKQNVTFYIGTMESGFELSPYEDVNPLPHLFNEVPMIHFKNNMSCQSDFEKVRSLCDDYDKLLSDASSELQQFAMAYLVFYGTEPNKDVLIEARKTGMFAIPGANKEAKIEFLTKNLNDDVIENHKKTLKNNIFLFTQTVDISDEKFVSTSGAARRWRLYDLENKAIIKERQFVDSLSKQYDIISYTWNLKGIALNTHDMDYVFTRNLPAELSEQINTFNAVYGKISNESAISLLPFIPNASEELAKMEAEKQYVPPKMTEDEIRKLMEEDNVSEEDLNGDISIIEVDIDKED